MEPRDMAKRQLELESVAAEPIKKLLIEGAIWVSVQLEAGQPTQPFPVDFRKRFHIALLTLWSDSITLAADFMALAISEGFKSHKATRDATIPDILSRFIADHGARRANQILDTTELQIRNLVLGGLRVGQARQTVFSELLEKIPGLEAQRAALITATEAHGASQYASYAMAKRSTILLTKTWNVVKDENTRGFPGHQDQFNHWVMDGTTIGLDDYFSIPNAAGGYENLLFPGDPNGSAGNVINCRCIQTYAKKER